MLPNSFIIDLDVEGASYSPFVKIYISIPNGLQQLYYMRSMNMTLFHVGGLLFMNQWWLWMTVGSINHVVYWLNWTNEQWIVTMGIRNIKDISSFALMRVTSIVVMVVYIKYFIHSSYCWGNCSEHSSIYFASW